MNKSVKILSVYITGLLLIIQSCTYPFQPEVDPEDTKILVVEGQITDETGPFRIKLTNSFEVDNLQAIGEPVTDANVEIFDDKGHSWSLYYDVNGWYKTADTLLKGNPGNTYTLNITTAEGIQYESTPVLMNDVPDIDSLYFGEVLKASLIDDQVVEEKWLEIYVDAQDQAGQTIFWNWEYEETWEVRTPKDSVKVEYCCIEDEADPFYKVFGTMGMVFFNVTVEFDKGNAREGWDNKKERCWVQRASNSIIIESVEDTKEKNINKFPVLSIPPESDQLDIKYSILVKQKSLNKELFEYFHRLKELNEQIGSIYDKMPEQIYGNISCCNSDKEVLGYFSASVVKTKRITINPYEHKVETKDPYEDCIYRYPGSGLGTIIGVANPKLEFLIGRTVGQVLGDVWCNDCRYYGTNVMPEYWEEE